MRRTPIRVALLLGLVVVVCLLGVLAYQTTRAVLSLRKAQAQSVVLNRQFAEGNLQGAHTSLAALQRSTRDARDRSDGRLWAAASRLPWVGRNLDAIRTAADVLDGLSHGAVPDGLVVSQSVRDGALRPAHGQFDLAQIAALAPTVRRAAHSATAAETRLARVDAAGLAPGLDRVVARLQDKVREVASTARVGSDAFRLLPTLLGRDQPRHYLLVVQNNAEIRATGGLPGSVSLLEAKAGRVSLGFQGDASAATGSAQPVVALTQGERDAFSDAVGKDFRQTTLTPNFPRAASFMAAMFREQRGQQVDGVVAVDPVALADVLRSTGPVRVGGTSLDADTLVATLLNQTYQRLADPNAQDAYFAKVGRAVFDALAQGRGDPAGAVRALAGAVGEHRVLVWSSRADEESVLQHGSVAGALSDGTDESAHVGVYLNDETAAKMQYYLRYRPTLVSRRCSANGTQTLEVSMELSSLAPPHGRGLARYVTGTGQYPPRGSMAMSLYIYAPPGGSVDSLTVDRQSRLVTTNRIDGRQVAMTPVLVGPGGKVPVTATVRTRAGQRGDPILDFTPGILPVPNGVSTPSTCG